MRNGRFYVEASAMTAKTVEKGVFFVLGSRKLSSHVLDVMSALKLHKHSVITPDANLNRLGIVTISSGIV